jgi:hypothetical protein
VKTVNRVGKYAASEDVDEIQLMKMVMELTEKDKMIMWSEGYIDKVIEKMPDFARDILEDRKKKWEDTKAYYKEQLEGITQNEVLKNKLQGERKEFALFVMEHYPEYQSLLFSIYDGNLSDDEVRKFVYRRRQGSRNRYLH